MADSLLDVGGRETLDRAERPGVSRPASVGFRNDGMPGGGVRDRVVVVGWDRSADTDRAHDAAVFDDRYGALAEIELVAAEREHALGEERAPREPLFEIVRDGLECGAGVGLGARDLRRDPQGAV